MQPVANRLAKSWMRGLLAACGCLWLATTAGCGSSVYATKYEARLKELKRTFPFADLSGLTTLEDDDLHVNVGVPKLFTEAPYTQLSPDPKESNKRINRSLVLPVFMQDLPGLKVTFHGVREDPKDKNSKLPFFLYIGDGPTANLKGKPGEGEAFPYKEWRDKVKAAFPDVKLPDGSLSNNWDKKDWEKVDAPTPQGQTVAWKRLVAKGKKHFDFERFGGKVEGTDADLDGYFEMWVYESPQWVGVLGWWCPEAIRADINIEELARLTAGTVEVTQDAAAGH